MGSGVNRMMAGSVTLPGTAYDVRTVGFRPRKVELLNADGECLCHWQSSMPDASMVKTIAAGTTTYDVADGVTPLSNGFTIGADSDMNVDGEKVHWAAWE